MLSHFVCSLDEAIVSSRAGNSGVITRKVTAMQYCSRRSLIDLFAFAFVAFAYFAIAAKPCCGNSMSQLMWATSS